MSLLRQSGSYLIIGLVQLLLDWAVFVTATASGWPVLPANLLGRVAGMLLGFWLNGRFTFAGPDGHRLGWRRFARFIAVWGVITAISTAAMAVVEQALGLGGTWLAKPLVEGALAGLSFVLMRHVVYR